VSTSVSTSIHNRVFHRKDWTSREGLFAFGWGLLAALFLIPLVFSFLFLMELVESHGKVVLSHEEATAIFDRYEMSGKDELPDQPVLKLENSGLLPIIVRNEKHVTIGFVLCGTKPVSGLPLDADDRSTHAPYRSQAGFAIGTK